MRYKKKPVIVDVVQFLGFSKKNGQVMFSERPQWIDDAIRDSVITFFGKRDTLSIETLEGEHTVEVNCWIIKGVHGELYSCKPDIFQETYEAVS